MKTHQQLLFLCTANFYRSRHAEAVFNHLAAARGLCWRAHSAGFRPELAPEDLSHHVERRLIELGVDLPRPDTSPRAISIEQLSEASLVIALNRSEHLPMIETEFPLWKNRVSYWEIADESERCPDFALPRIEAEVENLIGALGQGHALGRIEGALAEF